MATLIAMPRPVKALEQTGPFKLQTYLAAMMPLSLIDAQTMKIHHTGHHASYVEKLNDAVNKYPELKGKTIEELLSDLNKVPKEIREEIRNNGGGHYNHSLFWTFMGKDKGTAPTGKLKQDIDKAFGSFDNFKRLSKKLL